MFWRKLIRQTQLLLAGSLTLLVAAQISHAALIQEPKRDLSPTAESAVARLREIDLGESLAVFTFPFSPTQDAKARILGFGSDAIPSLLSALRQALDECADYDKERRHAMAASLERWRSWLAANPDEQPASRSRLIDDYCELLGKLRSVAAVPLIARSFEEDRPVVEIGTFHGTPTLRVLALIHIGAPAVPSIVDELRNAYDNVTLEQIRPTNESPTNASKDDASIEAEAEFAQKELCAALSTLGDESTVALLQTLLQTKSSMGAAFDRIVRDTIRQIRTPRYLRRAL